MMTLVSRAIYRMCRMDSVESMTADLVATGEVKRALDIGCGGRSPLSDFRPDVYTVGVDANRDAIERSRAADVHNEYVLADVLNDDVLSRVGGEKFDLVTLYNVIEHFPKRRGFELLERCEELSAKYIILETPNGFLPQGPEFGNPFQRHLSGWFREDFIGLGYDVFGSSGTHYIRGYAAKPKVNVPGAMLADAMLAKVLRVTQKPQHAFALVAIKDVRGVPARLGEHP